MVLLTFTGCASFSSIPYEQRYTVAIIGVQSNLAEEGKKWENIVLDEMTDKMLEDGRVRLIERANIEKIMKEHAFTQTGAVDESSAAKIGKLLGAESVLIGRLQVDRDERAMRAGGMQRQRFSFYVRFSGKIVHTGTGEILAAANSTEESREAGGSVSFTAPMDANTHFTHSFGKRENEVLNEMVEKVAEEVAGDLSKRMPVKPKAQ